MMEAASWCVVWTESRAEKKVAERVAALGHEVWLPLYAQRRRWSDRWKVVRLPLFPGYLFVRQVKGTWDELLRQPGILTVVKHDGRPALLTSGFVATLRAAVESEAFEVEPIMEPELTFSTGDEVIVAEGPLIGFRGVVREYRGGQKLLIWLAAVGRGIACTIGATKVVLAEAPRG